MWKSILKPEGSAIAGLATVGVVYGIYQLNIGSVAQTHATDANHPLLETSRKKAGLAALVLVGALTLITKDGNVGILGAVTIIAMQLPCPTRITSTPVSGKLHSPSPVA